MKKAGASFRSVGLEAATFIKAAAEAAARGQTLPRTPTAARRLVVAARAVSPSRAPAWPAASAAVEVRRVRPAVAASVLSIGAVRIRTRRTALSAVRTWRIRAFAGRRAFAPARTPALAIPPSVGGGSAGSQKKSARKRCAEKCKLRHRHTSIREPSLQMSLRLMRSHA